MNDMALAEIDGKPVDLIDPRKKGIDIVDIIRLVERGYDMPQTAKILNTTKQNISARLKKAGYRPGDMKSWNEDEEIRLKLVCQNVTKSLTPKDIKKISVGSRMNTHGIAFDKVRLLQDKSTQNVSNRTAITGLDSFLSDLESDSPPEDQDYNHEDSSDVIDI